MGREPADFPARLALDVGGVGGGAAVVWRGVMSETLFPVANALHIGNFQGCVNEAMDLQDLSETEACERDALMYRAYIAMGSAKVC